MCMDVLPVCMSVHWCPRKPESVGSPRARVTDDCELPYWCWELNPDPLEKQSVLLIAEPSLQPPEFRIIDCFISLKFSWWEVNNQQFIVYLNVWEIAIYHYLKDYFYLIQTFVQAIYFILFHELEYLKPLTVNRVVINFKTIIILNQYFIYPIWKS